MQVLEDAVAQAANPWPLRRERAVELAERYPHAAEMLRLYQALIPVQEAAYLEVRSNELQLKDVPGFAVDRVLPSVIDVTVASGPARLRDGVVKVFCTANLEETVRSWLDQQPLSPFETYIARASSSPLLEATPTNSLPIGGTETPSPLPGPPAHASRAERAMRAFEASGGSGRGSTCPSCGGLPQLSYFGVTGEALVTGPRYLVCSRCSNAWVFSRMTCASCGESEGRKLPIFQDDEQLKHIRVDGCRTCGKYLLTFDLRRDSKAVPIVDELAALPLDLYAKEHGLTKITPNLMGN